jgi:hypothetical protein
MRRNLGIRWAVWTALLLGPLLAAPAPDAHAAARGRFQSSANPGVPLGALTLRVLGAPVDWLTGWLRNSESAPAAPEVAALARADGWTTLGFPLRDSGRGILVEIRGRTELGPVEILFEDGALQRVEHSAVHTYGRGLYEIADFGDERRVMLVRFAARARSSRVTMRVLLARELPQAG